MKFTLCKKQYLYLALAVISMVLAVATHAFAQDAVPATNSSPDAPPNGAPDTQTLDTREERRAERAEVREERKAALEEQKQNRIINLARNVIGKMESAAKRMDQIITRIDARITILKERNIDTTQAEVALGNTRSSVAQAKNMIATLDASTLEAISSETPREKFQLVKSQFMVARTTLREAHENLKTVVSLLKEAVKTADQGTDASDAVQNEESLKTESSTPVTE